MVTISIDEASAEYPYVQVAEQLRAAITAGQITSLLPSIMELTEQTGLAPGTIRRAFRILLDEQLIVTRPGRGTFVRLPG